MESENEWVTRRSHFQVSHKHVLPVIFRAKKRSRTQSKASSSSIPPAFAETRVQLSDSITLVKAWIIEHADRMYRERPMNLKPGSLETPDILRDGKHTFTVWFEPTAATFALVTPSNGDKEDVIENDDNDSNDDKMRFDAFLPTPQALQIVAEVDE